MPRERSRVPRISTAGLRSPRRRDPQCAETGTPRRGLPRPAPDEALRIRDCRSGARSPAPPGMRFRVNPSGPGARLRHGPTFALTIRCPSPRASAMRRRHKLPMCGLGGAVRVQALGEFCALAVAEAAERLVGRDAAGVHDLGGFDPPDLGKREQHVEHLRGLEERGRVEQQLADQALPALRSRLSCARSARASMASSSAAMR
jgi:hypothetical protein